MSHLQYFTYPGFGEHAQKETHYSQAVRIGDKIEISGQGGWNPQTTEIPTDLGLEIDQAFSNVELTLKNAGGKGWEQVYKLRIYLAPYTDEATEHVVRNLREYCPGHAPLLTGVGVEKLAIEGMRIEIEVDAHVG